MNIEMIERDILKNGLATKQELRRRELTPEEWLSMPPLVQDWHCVANSRMVDRVLAEIADTKRKAGEEAERKHAARARQVMEGKAEATNAEFQASDEAVDVFLERFPQYCRLDSNRDRLLTELHRKGRMPSDLGALVETYQELASRGELVIDVSTLGLPGGRITGYDLRNHPQLDVILQPVRKVNLIDQMSADQYRVYNDKLDRDAGKKPPRSARAERDAETMFASWFDSAAGTGFGVFENQTREDVKRMIFEHLDEERITWSVGAVQQAAEYLHSRGVLHRESDVRSGTTGEFTSPGARMIIHRKAANPLTSAPPPPQPVEIVDKVKRLTLAQIRAMSGEEYARNMQNPEFVKQVDVLFNQ